MAAMWPMPLATWGDQRMLLAPKALVPPMGVPLPYLELGSDSLRSHQWLQPMPTPGFYQAPETKVASLQQLAGVSAQQDQEILETLRSSGIALTSLELEPEKIRQMLSQVPRTPPAPQQVTTSSWMTAAHEYLRSYRPQRGARWLTYPSGVSIDFGELAPVMRVVAMANSQWRSRIFEAIHSGMHVRTAIQVFRSCDPSGCGFLTWSNGQIRDFVMTVFMQLGLVPPAEVQTYAAHTLFDMTRSMCLSACDCLCLVDVMLRAIYLHLEQPRSRSPSPRSRATSVPLSAMRRSRSLAKADPFTEFRNDEIAALLKSTAKAHATNRRLERELKTLRAAAWNSRQLSQAELKEDHLQRCEAMQERSERRRRP
eukprot:Skav236434  [mRNA]  locus=scaffold1156:320971:322356:- [translate_table: standard]